MNYEKEVAIAKEIIKKLAEEKVTVREAERICETVAKVVTRSEVSENVADKWDGLLW